MPANLENLAVATGLEKLSFHSSANECSNYHTIALISHASKGMLKILQARLQQYVNCELPDVQATFRKRNQRSNCQHPLDHRKSTRVPEKHLFLLYWLSQSLDCVHHNKLWKILKEMGIPDHLIYLLWNLYSGREARLRTRHGTTDWFQIRKGIYKEGNDNPVCETAKETQMYRTVIWTLWEREKERVGWFGRMALKHL